MYNETKIVDTYDGNKQHWDTYTNKEATITSSPLKKSQHEVTWEYINNIRCMVDTLASDICNHVNSSGSAHISGDQDKNGFMTPEQLNKLIYIQKKLDTLCNDINSNNLPVGSICWWNNNISDIPKGWKLADGTNGTLNMVNRTLEGGDVNYIADSSGGKTLIYRLTKDFQPYVRALYCIEKVSDEYDKKVDVSNLKNSWLVGVMNG